MNPETPIEDQLASASQAAQQGRSAEAIPLFEEVLRRNESNLVSLQWLSALYLEAGRTDDAVNVCRTVTKLLPEKAEAHNGLGLCLLHAGRYLEAVSALQRAIELQPRVASLYLRLGTAFQRGGDLRSAIATYRQGLGYDPNNLGLLRASLELLMVLGDYRAAVSACAKIHLLDPTDGSVLATSAKALHELDLYDETDQELARALKFDPANATTYSLIGYRHLEEGDLEVAAENFARSIDLQESQGSSYLGLVQCRKESDPESRLIAQMVRVASEGALPPEELHQLEFAAGKAYEDAGDFGSSMKHYDEANRLVLEHIDSTDPFDPGTVERAVDQTIRLFTKEHLQRTSLFGNPSELPIIVIGMIRSGTTLTEQILASHPSVAGAGEQKFWSEAAVYSNSVKDIDPDRADIAQTADAYLETLRQFGTEKLRVADKMPGNFMHAGSIHIHFPNARIVHIRRSPIDTCLSIWSTQFSLPPRFTGRRSNVVQVYMQYLRMMEHWRQVLPRDRFLDIDYNALVADRETTIRQMIAFCGLPWAAECLHPERTVRRIITPSLIRVRKPIDASRVARWKRFEPWLGEFRELLALE